MQRHYQGYTIRPAKAEDARAYFDALFNPLEAEVAKLTGSQAHYPAEVVIPFFLRCVADPQRYDFLILNPDGCIVGESVINEYDPQTNSANYRIAISGSENREKGIGTWAVRCACSYAFEQLHLNSLTLGVFDFNPRARRVYEKCGFEPFGVEDGEVLMQLTHQKWLSLR